MHRRRRLAGRRPQHVDVVEEELGITGGNGGVLELRLGDEKPVERIAVMEGELGHPESVPVLDRQGRQTHRIQA